MQGMQIAGSGNINSLMRVPVMDAGPAGSVQEQRAEDCWPLVHLKPRPRAGDMSRL